MSLFAEATKKAAKVRFKQPQLDAEGQEVEVGRFSKSKPREQKYKRILHCAAC